jgi:hypothetical protein
VNDVKTAVDGLARTAGDTATDVKTILGRVDATVSSRATQTSVNTLQSTSNLINGKVDTALTQLQRALDRLDALSQQVAAFQDENLILQIELNLLGGPRYNNVKFQLPKAQGGYLEKVRDVVDSRINETVAAGLVSSADTLAQARNSWNTGVRFISLGSYKDAYASFRTAYLLLSVVPGNRQP